MEEVTYGVTDEMLAMEEAMREESLNKREGLWGMLRYMHADERISGFITLETTPLKPLVVPEAADSSTEFRQALLHILLNSTWAEMDPERLPPPWAYMCMEWPSKKILVWQDLRALGLMSEGALSSDSVVTKDYADAIEKALQEGGDIPRPPAELETIYETVLGRQGLGFAPAKVVTPREMAPVVLPEGSEVSVPEDGDTIKAPEGPLPSPVTEAAAEPEGNEPESDEPLLSPPLDPLLTAPDKPGPEAPPAEEEVDPDARRTVSMAVEAVKPTPAKPKTEDTMDLQDFLKKIH